MPGVRERARRIVGARRLFPSKEEQIWLVLAARKEDAKEAEFARNRLWAGCERLLIKVIRKTISNSYDQQEALHWAWLEIFLPAIGRYNPEAGMTFFNYVANGVSLKLYRWKAQKYLIKIPEHTLLKAMREGAKAPHLEAALKAMFVSSSDSPTFFRQESEDEAPVKEASSSAPPSQTSKKDQIPTEQAALKAILTEVIKEGLKALEPREREVVMLLFGFNGNQLYAQWQIAKLLGTSRSTVGNIQARALKKLGQYILEKFPQARLLEI